MGGRKQPLVYSTLPPPKPKEMAMWINGRTVRQAPRTISPGETIVEIWKEGSHVPWPVAADTIDDLCDTLREIVMPDKSKHEEFSELVIHWADIACEHATIAADAARAGRAVMRIEAARPKDFSYKTALEKIRVMISNHFAKGTLRGVEHEAMICKINNMLNEALGEAKIGSRWGNVKGAFAVEPDYKAALEKIKIIIDDMPQLERWLGAAEAAKGFKLICDLLNETP